MKRKSISKSGGRITGAVSSVLALLLAVTGALSPLGSRLARAATIVTTFAGMPPGGYADDSAYSARFTYPRGVGVDSGGNVYVADNDNHRVRRITPAGDVCTLAGGRKS